MALDVAARPAADLGTASCSVLSELRAFLVRQRALGLRGVEMPPLWASRRAAPPAPLPSNERPQEAVAETLPWPALREALGACAACRLHEARTGAVLGRGGEQADVMFFSDAPSRDDDLQGEAFVGRSGALLSKMIAAMGLSAQTAFVGNIVACRPPRNRTVAPDEFAACHTFFVNQVALVQPRIIVALGEGASRALFRCMAEIDELRGTWTTFLGIPVVSTYHPQMLLDAPNKKRLCWQDLQVVMARLADHARGDEVQT